MTTTTLKRFEGTKREGSLNLMVFGDVHLGNNLTKAPETISGLMKMLPKNKETAELDMIIIEGDLFDEGLMYNSEYLVNIQSWMIWLIRRCVEFDIALRVLEGTPSHDNHQSRNFLPIIEAMSAKIDFKYVEDMIVEEHAKFGTILYVPDEWSTSTDHTYEAARALLSTYGLTQVHYCIMHGAFEYQLPPIASDTTHNSKLWQELVVYCIFVGHIHQYSEYGKIVAAGSSDRHTHGDEAPKGHIRATLDSEGLTIKFIENLLAKKFVTVDCRNLSVEDTLAKLEDYLTLPKGSFIRLRALRTDNTSTAASFLAAEHPDFNWKVEVQDADSDVDVQKIAILPTVRMESRSITPNNIEAIVLEYAKRRYTGDLALGDNDINQLRETLGDLCKVV